jgi:hypothetical protein
MVFWGPALIFSVDEYVKTILGCQSDRIGGEKPLAKSQTILFQGIQDITVMEIDMNLFIGSMKRGSLWAV